MKYRVLCDCYGFKGGYWTKDQIVEFGEDENPPEHFAKVTGKEEAPPAEPATPNTFSEINQANESDKPVTGMVSKPKPGKSKK